MPAQYDAAFDVIVVGGGLAGISAAISAARLGAKTALLNDRPMLGGASSSECRIQVSGAATQNPWAKETGIIEELVTADLWRNHDRYNTMWDLVLYEWVRREPNLALFLNTSVREAIMATADRIEGLYAVQVGNEKSLHLRGEIFIDCSGDGTLGASAGAEFRQGQEARSEFNEPRAPEDADTQTMGNSLYLRARDVGYPVPFTPPPWAAKYPTEHSLFQRGHDQVLGGFFWWIEVGGFDYDTVRDNEEIRDELLRHVLGVWDHIKNHGDHGADNYVLESFGWFPSKRENRRFVGDHILTGNEEQARTLFADRVAYGGFYMDIHTMGGILRKGVAPEPRAGYPPLMEQFWVAPYSIPLSSLYSTNVSNLLFAGRDISVSHVGLGSPRVQRTCAVIGQAAGTAAYFCHKYGASPRDACQNHIAEIQQSLLKQDCYIPRLANRDPADLARSAVVSASSSAALEFPEGSQRDELTTGLGQLFPVSAERIDSVSLRLTSELAQATTLELGLRAAEDVWDLTSEKDLAVGKAVVPSNGTSWVQFDLHAAVEPGKLYWVHLEPCEGISWWYEMASPPGIVPVRRWPGGRWCPFKESGEGAPYGGAYAMGVAPSSEPYGPENVISGVARPECWTNLWMSDPLRQLPQWLELDFGRPVTFDTVCLTFDTYLSNRRVQRTPWRNPECVRDYELSVWRDDGWTTLLRVEGNFHRRRVHRLGTTMADRLRVTVLATNGDRSARIYEMRVYQE
jgi:hypothetical protein